MLHDMQLAHKKAARHKRAHHLMGGKVSDKATIAKGVHEHESAMHPGKGKTKLKLKCGGMAKGGKSKGRLDRGGLTKAAFTHGSGSDEEKNHGSGASGYAKGGRAKSKKGSVNVTIVTGGNPPAPPMPMMPPRPAMPMPAGGPPGMPGGAPPMAGPMPMGARPPGMKKGGRAIGGKATYTAGAATGEGRLEKGREYGPISGRKKA